jgi:NADPH-dependent glutamate synthase beta subunit-like oxidoreductase/glutamate synthase domain-containing protein 3/NAD-dependent dihydropyrimidine dehydrogenase PreA subunit
MPAKEKDMKDIVKINTIEDEKRISTQELMHKIWEKVDCGCNNFEITASGQHNIGGSLWSKNGEDLNFYIKNPGQRVGSMGVKGTNIYVEGPAPADVGWLNSGANIVVKGDSGDTTAPCAASGKIFIGGHVGTRSGALMKCDPKFDAPELWVLKGTGSFPFEFMGGGVAVVCGWECEDFKSVLGDRACVGMLGGVVYFRGHVLNISDDVFVLDLDEKDIDFLSSGMKDFLQKIGREELYKKLTDFSQWKKIVAKTYEERQNTHSIDLGTFREKIWMQEIGGSIFKDLIEDDFITYDLLQTGAGRLKIPVWKNYAYSAPCEYNCPVKIPTQKRFSLLRAGKIKEALELVLKYSPFPASVCGQVCPNLCLNDCSRLKVDEPLDVKMLGQLSAEVKLKMPKTSKKEKVAIVGAGTAGLSCAWQLLQKGYTVEIFEQDSKIGGKLSQVIPEERLSQEILKTELERFDKEGIKINLNTKMTKELFKKLEKEYDALVLATGAHGPVVIPFEGYERLIKGLDFLKGAKNGKKFDLGKKVVVIGAGNAAMDVVLEAYKQGAKDVCAIDIQKPSAFEKEIKDVEKLGAKILWPCFTEKITQKGVQLKDGRLLEADSVIIAIGDRPIFDYLDKKYLDEKSKVSLNEFNQSEFNKKVFAIGDSIKCGLFTNAIADGRNCSFNVMRFLNNEKLKEPKKKEMIPQERIKSEYYECYNSSCDNEENRCMSCGYCRDCGLCMASCPNNAISRIEKEDGTFEYVSDETKCIGCGICEGLCPCGIWEMALNI